PTLLSRRPPPPRPALFPYTTLFRSAECTRFLLGRHAMFGHAPPTYFRSMTATRLPSEPRVQARSLPPAPLPRMTMSYSSTFGMLDRKSTRLNSSHVAISYAVFCLKK